MKHNFIILIAFTALALVSTVVFCEYYINIKAVEQGLQQCIVWNDLHTHYDILWRKNCLNED